MIILDTNVLSELMKSQPNKSVVSWIGRQQATNLFITTLTQAEILYGLEILPAGKRRTALKKAAKAMFELDPTFGSPTDEVPLKSSKSRAGIGQKKVNLINGIIVSVLFTLTTLNKTILINHRLLRIFIRIELIYALLIKKEGNY